MKLGYQKRIDPARLPRPKAAVLESRAASQHLVLYSQFSKRQSVLNKAGGGCFCSARGEKARCIVALLPVAQTHSSSCFSCLSSSFRVPSTVQGEVASGLAHRDEEQIWGEEKRKVMSRGSTKEDGLLTLACSCK